jgi:hypothetical protein
LLRACTNNPKLSFADYVAQLPVAFTVLVSARQVPWLALHPEQVHGGPASATAYEIGATAWGLPVAVWPRENSGNSRLPALNRVNEAELERYGCRGLLRRGSRGWRLTDAGREWLELLTFLP